MATIWAYDGTAELECDPPSAAMAANIRRWADALTQGGYKQGKKWLRVNDRFCCLGVACDLTGRGQWALMASEPYDPNTRGAMQYEVPFEEATDVSLPIEIGRTLGLAWIKDQSFQATPGVQTTAGIRYDGQNWVIGGEEFHSLATANDKGKTFKQIARALRAYADEIEEASHVAAA